MSTPDLFAFVDEIEADQQRIAAERQARIDAEARAEEQRRIAAEAAEQQRIMDETRGIYNRSKGPLMVSIMQAVKVALPRLPNGDPVVKQFRRNRLAGLNYWIKAFIADPDRVAELARADFERQQTRSAPAPKAVAPSPKPAAVAPPSVPSTPKRVVTSSNARPLNPAPASTPVVAAASGSANGLYDDQAQNHGTPVIHTPVFRGLNPEGDQQSAATTSVQASPPARPVQAANGSSGASPRKASRPHRGGSRRDPMSV